MNNSNFLDRQTPELTEEDKDKFSKVMGNSNKIQEFIRNKKVTEDTIMKMMVYERQTKKRGFVLDKLLSRLNTANRKKLQKWWNPK